MAKVKQPLLSLDARRKLGDEIVYGHRQKANIVERRPIPTDARSVGQLSWRHMFLKVVAMWQALSAAEKEAWESLARPRHMTGYAWFVSQALRPNPGIYLPLQGGTMSGDIDMAGNKVENLPDPLAQQEAVTKQYFEDNLPVGGYTEGARVYHSADQTITTATETLLAFNSERYDTDTIHDTITNNSRLTCKTAGKYVISATIKWQSSTTGHIYLTLLLGGATGLASVGQNPMSGPAESRQSVTTVYDLAVNNYVEVMVYHTHGSNRSIKVTGNFSPEFMMQRVG